MSHVVHAVFEMQTKRHFCGHCHQNLSKTVFYKHRTLYFNSRSKEWSKERMFPAGVLNELSFTIPDDELLNVMDEPVFILSNGECTAESCSNQGKRDWIMSYFRGGGKRLWP